MATSIPSNRCAFTLGEIAAATDGKLVGGDARAMTIGVSTDTREMQRGALFVALMGAASDGHDYLTQAAARGALGALVSRGRELASLPCVAVEDTLAALGFVPKADFPLSRSAVPPEKRPPRNSWPQPRARSSAPRSQLLET